MRRCRRSSRPSASQHRAGRLSRADHDCGTSCSTLSTCLQQARAWSDTHRGHVPLPMLLGVQVRRSRHGEARWTAEPVLG
ncbi:Ca2+-dependent phosphoinositide-specific phospholipase C [Actinomadura macra]|uniref:Ca2+-dependent phosphoinositide-specific phospholipase C n=1 Tax=Actinomadura macra TaxID=46164 RepID=UPI00350E50B5